MGNETLTNQELFSKLLQVIENQAKKTFLDISNEIKSENGKLLEKIEKQNIEISTLKQASQVLEDRCLRLERDIRKNNILIFGLLPPTADSEILKLTAEKIDELLGVKLHKSEINNIYQLKSIKGVPIKIEFVSYLNKITILKNCHKLKSTKIFIAHDLCFEDRQNLKILQEHLKQARANNFSAVIRGSFLIVNGKKFHVSQLTTDNIFTSEDHVNNTTDIGEEENIPTGNSPEHVVKRKKNYAKSTSTSSETSTKPITRSTAK